VEGLQERLTNRPFRNPIVHLDSMSEANKRAGLETQPGPAASSDRSPPTVAAMSTVKPPPTPNDVPTPERVSWVQLMEQGEIA
jgi:hypothetical protein